MHSISIISLPLPVATSQPGLTKGLPARFGAKYCPTMDLVAVFPQVVPTETVIDTANAEQSSVGDYYADDEDEVLVDVYRLSGQKVFTIGIESHGGILGISDIAWRDDGVILAIATSDNTIRLVNSFSGKIVHTFQAVSPVQSASKKPVSATSSPSSKRKSTTQDNGPRKRRCIPTSIHYSTYFTDPNNTKALLGVAREERGIWLDDLLSLNADIDQMLKTKADLPKELVNIDVEQFLPRLAVLPANGMGEDDVFSTRSSIDAMFHPAKSNARSSSTDIVTIGQSHGHLHIRVFDAFAVGDIDLSHALNMPFRCVLGAIRQVVTHPFSEQIYALAEGHEDEPTRLNKSPKGPDLPGTALHLFSLDLRFVRQMKHTFPILATKATQLYNLIKYLRQIETQLAREVKTAFELPSRFIRTLEEDLREQDGEGSTFESSAYHIIVTGEVHGKFREWLVDVLGDRGVKRWEKSVSECLDLIRRLINENWCPAVERASILVSRLSSLAHVNDAFDVDKRMLDSLRDTIDVMAVLGEDLLRDTNKEISGFNAFVKWLKREVEMASLEDTSEKLDEMRDGSDHSDVRKVLKYISERLHDTSVKQYIRDDYSDSTADEDELQYYAKFKESRQTSDKRKLTPSMKFLTTKLTSECDRLFAQVGTRLKENVLVQYICRLVNDIDADTMDARLVHEPEHAALHVIGKRAASRDELCYLTWAPDTSSEGSITSKHVKLKDVDNILDIKIAGDDEALILARTSAHREIMSINLQDTARQSTRHIFGDSHDNFTKAGLQARSLEINARKNRRTITVLDEQGQGYGVFDLDSRDSGGSNDDEAMSG